MTELAAALSAAMTTARTALAVLDAQSGQWAHHPWPEVHARAENVAERITDAGATTVGLIGDPTVEFMAAIPGAFFAGAGLSILPGPIRRADPEQWARATLDRFRAIGVTTVFSHGTELEALRNNDARDGAIVVQDLAEVAHEQRSTTFRGPDNADVAILQGTAGSTGTPRTARISPAASLANLRGLVTRVNVDHRTRMQSWLPIYHDMGLAVALVGMLGRADLWQAPTAAFAGSPFSWLKWLTESRATMTAAPNMAFNLIGKYARSLNGFDLSNLGFTLNGGEPVDCVGYQRFADEMKRFGLDASSLAPSYGLAESTCAVTIPEPFSGLRVDDVTVTTEATQSSRRFAVLGHPIPGMNVRINTDNPHATEVTGREVGEVEVRGTSLMTGYVGEAPIDRGQWLPTGDLGYLTDDGLVVCGRAKELITVAGRNVFPTEIERIAGEIDGVRDGCVVAVGTGEASARPGLVIAAEFKGDNEPAARSAVVARVAAQCGVVPADVVFLKPGALPRTSSGKLRRLEVKRTLEGRRTVTATTEPPQAASTEDYRELLERVFDDRVARWTAEAEETERFPRKLIEYLGASGVFTAKWGEDRQPDVAKVVDLARALGRLGSAGIGVGVSLHDSAIAILRRFGKSDLLRGIAEQAIRGEAVLCIGASEQSGGSDLQIVGTEIRSARDGFEVKGIKKFVSLSPIADHVMAVARSVDHDPNSRHGSVAVIAVPLAQCEIQAPYRKVGAGPLDTAAVHIDTWVPADALVARPGTGLAAISWGLAHERLSIAGQVSSSCQRTLGITLARMMKRQQFGHTLYEHQALRMRMADLQARVDLLRYALDGIAATGKLDLRAAAAIKVTAARLGEEVMSECMHIFGGSGYLVDETPLGNWWRDMKLARVGGGTDEVLWELVAAAMKPDHDGYAEFNQPD